MASSVNYDPCPSLRSLQFRVTKYNFNTTQYNTLINGLDHYLKIYFEEASAKWEYCPDLSQEPFNLAAPGLYIKMSIIEFEPTNLSTENVNIFYVEDILGILERNAAGYYNKPFIFGNTSALHPLDNQIHELVMNASFSPAINGRRESNNRSCIVYISKNSKCETHMLTEYRPSCVGRGTFFLSEGSPGPVIKIYAKNFIGPKYLGKSKQLMNVVHQSIQHYSEYTGNVIGFAGVYTTTNVLWSHSLTYNPEFKGIRYSHRTSCTVQTPETRFGIFNSNVEEGFTFVDGVPSLCPISLQGAATSHCLSHHSSAERYCKYQSDDVEYLGYFTPIETLYRITS